MLTKLRALVERLTAPTPEFDRWREEQTERVRYWRDFKVNHLKDQIRIGSEMVESMMKGDWMPAEFGVPDLVDMVDHIGTFEITEGTDARGYIFRRAEVQIFARDSRRLHDFLYEGGRRAAVNWRGNYWQLDQIEVDHRNSMHGRYITSDPDITIALIGFPRRDMSQKQYLYGREKPAEMRLDAVNGPAFIRFDQRPIERFEGIAGVRA